MYQEVVTKLSKHVNLNNPSKEVIRYIEGYDVF